MRKSKVAAPLWDSLNTIELLEWACLAPPCEHEDQWLWLTTQFLGLSPIHIPAVQNVLKQGRWRKARNPKNYVKVCAERELSRMGLGDDPLENIHLNVPNIADDEGHPLTHDSYIDYLSYEGPVKEGAVWKHRNIDFYEEGEYDEDGASLTPRERLLRLVPADLKMDEALPEEVAKFFAIDSITKVDWYHIAARAGLDRGERYVLLCKVRGISRESAVARWKTDRRQKWVEAAWRRFGRNSMQRLRVVLENKNQKAS